jgi:hypothetical protein
MKYINLHAKWADEANQRLQQMFHERMRLLTVEVLKNERKQKKLCQNGIQLKIQE